MLRYVSVPQWRFLKKRGRLVRIVGQTSYLHAEYYLHYTHAPATVAVPTVNYVKPYLMVSDTSVSFCV